MLWHMRLPGSYHLEWKVGEGQRKKKHARLLSLSLDSRDCPITLPASHVADIIQPNW